MGLERMVMSQVSQSSLASCRKEFKSRQSESGFIQGDRHSVPGVWATSEGERARSK